MTGYFHWQLLIILKFDCNITYGIYTTEYSSDNITIVYLDLCVDLGWIPNDNTGIASYDFCIYRDIFNLLYILLQYQHPAQHYVVIEYFYKLSFMVIKYM